MAPLSMLDRSHPLSRRDVLRGAASLAAGVSLGFARRTGAVATPPAAAAVAPCVALSLAELCRRAPRGVVGEVADLAGITRLLGFVHDARSDDVVVLGRREAGPRMHVDDLAVVLRHAASPSPVPPIGCTIDPLPDAADPWTIQRAEIFGIPVCRMGVRHVAIDYDLKWQSAGLARQADIVPSIFAMEHDAIACEENAADDAREVTHRFWFCALLPPGPRYTADADGCLVDRPVDVQLLTEQEFLQRGRRVGAGAPSPSAQRFAETVTAAMRDGRYAAALITDFRLIELCRLLRHCGTSLGGLRYLLETHRPEPVDFDGYVGGVSRREEGEILCAHRIVRTAEVTGEMLKSERRVRRYRLEYRGGVDAAIAVAAGDVRADDGALSALRARVFAARPAGALTWEVA